MEFVVAIVERDQIRPEAVTRWERILCSNACLDLRKLAFEMLGKFQVSQFPRGANLSEFAMQRFNFPPGKVLQKINFADAQLNGVQLSRTVFEACDFSGSNLANVVFDEVGFRTCKGVPIGLATARGNRSKLPEPWSSQTQKRSKYWADQRCYHGASIVPAAILTSVAFSPDGARILTGSYDNTARLWDAGTGETCWSIFGLPSSWAVLEKVGVIRAHGPDLWKYVA